MPDLTHMTVAQLINLFRQEAYIAPERDVRQVLLEILEAAAEHFGDEFSWHVQFPADDAFSPVPVAAGRG
jgi:hypothetical protein